MEYNVKYIHSLKLHCSKVIQVFFFSIQISSSFATGQFDRLTSSTTQSTHHMGRACACSFHVYWDFLVWLLPFACEMVQLTF